MISFHRLFFFFALLYPSFQDILDLDEEDTCYENNKPVFCLPKFENVVEGKKITASSTCGLKNKSRICLKKRNEYLKCDVCDSTDRTKQHPTDFLTDSDTPNKTCWISEALMTPPPHNVSIRIHFGKSFELTYISIVFCQDAPDSVALYKSMDYGQHWTPFQYYSSSCMDFYGVRPNQTITRDNEQEALCSPLKGGVSATYDTPTIAFSTLEHRPNSFNLDNSPVLQDWVTATDIKIIFDRLLQNNALASSYMTMHYAVSDLSIGGRCKCNGHADRCITDEFGRLKCVCKHNTEGRDCERCKPLYQDKPWARATKQNANECVRCNCNGHSNVCRFNKELYEWSGHTSGGICQDCKHNTAGRFCHYCKEKYYRDVTVKISHEQACKACDCHHYGSKGKVCNSANGQCPCKVGVIGRKCNLCATGYQQTRSKIVPCQRKISGRKSDRNRKHRRKKNCWKCLKRSKKANATKFCKRDYAFHVHVLYTKLKKIKDEEYLAHSVIIKMVYKRLRRSGMSLKKNERTVLLVKYLSKTCSCPQLLPKKDYLILTQLRSERKRRSYVGRQGLLLNRKTVVLDWKNTNYMERKVDKFQKRQRYLGCN